MTDILAAIDAAVDGVCADGCGRKLDPNGPSAYWATEHCQERWQHHYAVADGSVTHDGTPSLARHVESAHSRRLGYEPVLTVLDEIHVWDQAMADYAAGVGPMAEAANRAEAARMLYNWGSPAVRDRDYDPQPTVVGDDWIYRSDPKWLIANHGPVAYRRQCGTCRQATTVIDGVRINRNLRALISFNSDPSIFDEPSMPERCHLCAVCRTPFDGPMTLAQYQYDELRWAYHLRLAAGNGAATYSISREAVNAGYAAQAWTELHNRAIEAITYREPCSLSGCREKARRGYVVRRSVDFDGFTAAPGRLRLCYEHHYALDYELIRMGHMLPTLPDDLRS